MHLKVKNNSFTEKYIEIVAENNASDTDKIYITSTDIYDAYGSIIPGITF